MLMLTLVMITPSDPPLITPDDADVVMIIPPVEEEMSTSLAVLLYSVNRKRFPLVSMICLLPRRDGEESVDETLPPHFCVGSPGQVVLQAEAGYSMKSSEASVGRL